MKKVSNFIHTLVKDISALTLGMLGSYLLA